MNDDTPISQTGPDEIAKARPATNDRETLERAREIARNHGQSITAGQIDMLIDRLPSSPPQPPGKTVRIAVAIVEKADRFDGIMIGTESSDKWMTDTEARAEAVDRATCYGGDITHFAWVSAVIPPVAIPVVEGRIE